MSVLKLKKVTVCGLAREKRDVLDGLQTLGCLHLVSLRPPPAEPEKVLPPRPEGAYRALRYLSDCPTRRRQMRHDGDFDVDRVVAQTLDVQARARAAADRRDFLQQRIAQVEPWGDFHLPPLERLGGQRLWFYIVPLYQLKQIDASAGFAWQVVHKDNRHAWVVAIDPEEPPPHAFPVARTHIGERSLTALRHDLEQSEIELEELEAQRAALTRWVYLLTQNLARTEDRAALLFAAEQTFDDSALFTLQGWVPERNIERVHDFCETRRLAVLIEPPGAHDAVPTLLDNPPQVAAGEDLVGFFQTPSYRDWDPSPVLFLSFALFFAMILSDAGYALLISAIMALFWKRMGSSATGRRLRVLGATVAGTALLWGILVGSYFGVEPGAGTLAGTLGFIDLHNFDAMIRLSVTIGVVHLLLANGFKAYQFRGHPSAVAALGWCAMLLGGLLLWFGHDGFGPALQIPIGWGLIAIGAVAVLLFSSARPVSRPLDWLWRLIGGLQALTNVTRAFGDVLSYMRLFALGLASASLAITFNQLAGDVAVAVPGIGMFLSILILLFGHVLNFILAVLSGVVHGLRLNFIEFYNWGVSEEGYPFRAFAKKEMQHE